MSKTLRGKRVVVVGLGKSGEAAVRFALLRGAAKVVVADARETRLPGLPLEYRFGPFTDETFEDADVIVLSPGVPPQNPAVAAAAARGVVVVNEPGLAFAEITAPVIAVTGTSGKTTTTTLIGDMLRAAGKRVFVGGNIGEPLLDFARSGEHVDVVVAELSSFQIEVMAPFVPRVVVYTPIAEDHLDRHGSVAEYHRVKGLLATWAAPSSLVVINPGNAVHRQLSAATEARVLGYSRTPLLEGAWHDPNEDRFYYRVGPRNLTWPGRSRAILGGNRENLAAAAVAAIDLGASDEAVSRVIADFRGIRHRLELVRELEGVRWFNDSKATNVVAALNALESFDEKRVVLIVGGKDKKIDFAPLRPEVARACKLVVAIGEAKERLIESLDGSAPLRAATTLADAVAIAQASAGHGDDVVLAPACSSFDMFRSYEDRGDQFRALVERL